MTNWWTFEMVPISAAGPMIQPIFQPVSEKILPAEPTRTVRARIPGRVEGGTWVRPSKVRCS